MSATIYIAPKQRSEKMMNLIANMRAACDDTRIKAEAGRARYRKVVALMRLGLSRSTGRKDNTL